MHYIIIMPFARYDAEARADAVSRGLAVRTVGSYDLFRLALSVEGSFADVERWSNDHEGCVVAELIEPNPKPNMEPNTNTTQARALLLAALESYGSDALEHAERARALVGIDGIRDIAESLSRDDDMPHESARVLGALAALLGESDPPQTVFGTEESAAGAFDFVSAGGYFGVWDGIEG